MQVNRQAENVKIIKTKKSGCQKKFKSEERIAEFLQSGFPPKAAHKHEIPLTEVATDLTYII